MLIINADDFGLDENTNKAIIHTFKKGLCSSTTIMATMPGFEEACQLCHENKLINHTGLHLVLDKTHPLTEKIKSLPKFCSNDGMLCVSKTRPNFRLKTFEKTILAEEIRTQIKLCKFRRIPITHVDSHFHIHTEWSIANILIPIVRQEGIPYIRISRNFGPNIPCRKKVYKYIFNNRLRIAALTRTKYFGSIEDFIFFKKQRNISNIIKSCEIMIHPGFNDKGGLIAKKVGVVEDSINDTENKPLEESIREIDSYRDAVSFSGVIYL